MQMMANIPEFLLAAIRKDSSQFPTMLSGHFVPVHFMDFLVKL